MPTRTCSKCKTVTDNFSKTDRYCRDCRSAINKSKHQPVKSKGIIKLCSKCNNPVGDDKHSYCKSCKSIYDRERFKKIVLMLNYVLNVKSKWIMINSLIASHVDLFMILNDMKKAKSLNLFHKKQEI